MANGDIPVEGSAVDIGGGAQSFTITARNGAKDDEKLLRIRMTQGKQLHVFVKADITDRTSPEFDEDVDNQNWVLRITERP